MRRGRFVVVDMPSDSAATSSSVSNAFDTDSPVDGVGRVRRVRLGRCVVVELVDKFIISTVIFARIFSCISLDGPLDGVGRGRLVRRGLIVVELAKSSAFHTSYVSVSGSASLYSTLSYVSPTLSSSTMAALGWFTRDLLIRKISLKMENSIIKCGR